MRFKISQYVKSELNKISFILKLSYYKRLLPKGGNLMNMINDAPVTWEDVTWVNINKGNPREVGKNDFVGEFPNIVTKGDYSVFDFQADPEKRISFELYGKLSDSDLPLKIRVDRNKNDTNYSYSLFLKDKKGIFKLVSRPNNISEFNKILKKVHEKFKNLGDEDIEEIENENEGLLDSFSKLISGSLKNKEIIKYILEEYEKKEKEKPLYLFKFEPEKRLREGFINLNFSVEKDLKEDSNKRNNEYEKKILEILKNYIDKNLSDKIDLDKFNFSYKPDGSKLFGIKVKVK